MSDDFFERAPGQRFTAPPAPSGPTGQPSAAGQDGAPGQMGMPDGSTGHPPRPHRTVERYRTSHMGVAVLIGIVAVALVIAMVWFGTRPSGPPGGKPSATPTPTQPLHTPVPGGQGIEFKDSYGDATGYWEILNYAWDDQGVTLTCRITVDTGTLSYTFLALDNETGNDYEAVPTSTLQSGTVGQGQQVIGSVRFIKNRGDTEIILADARMAPITALGIKG